MQELRVMKLLTNSHEWGLNLHAASQQELPRRLSDWMNRDHKN
jgi:hypothetical protein